MKCRACGEETGYMTTIRDDIGNSENIPICKGCVGDLAIVNQNISTSIPCQHKWMYFDTKKYYDVGDFNTKFTRIDNFYCEKCCETKTKVIEDYCRKEPDWY